MYVDFLVEAVAVGFRGWIEFLVGSEVRSQFPNRCKCYIKPGWHGGGECAPKFYARQCRRCDGSRSSFLPVKSISFRIAAKHSGGIANRERGY